jgi:hypothetical protein
VDNAAAACNQHSLSKQYDAQEAAWHGLDSTLAFAMAFLFLKTAEYVLSEARRP